MCLTTSTVQKDSDSKGVRLACELGCDGMISRSRCQVRHLDANCGDANLSSGGGRRFESTLTQLRPKKGCDTGRHVTS